MQFIAHSLVASSHNHEDLEKATPAQLISPNGSVSQSKQIDHWIRKLELYFGYVMSMWEEKVPD
jgi:hypothetical protein